MKKFRKFDPAILVVGILLAALVAFGATFDNGVTEQVTENNQVTAEHERLTWIEEQISGLQEAVEQVDAKPAALITDLPDDGKLHHLSIMLHDNWKQRPTEVALYREWTTGEKAAHKCLSHVYVESNSHYQMQMKPKCPTLPCVVITDKDGKVEYKATGKTAMQPLPERLFPLFPRLRARLKERRPIYIFPWRRPKPQPTPAPDDTPEPDETVVDVDVVIADTDPPPIEESGSPVGLLAVLAGIGGGALSVGSKFRRDISF